MPNEEKISQLDAVVTPSLTDIFPVVQAAEVGVKTRKETLTQVRDLIQQNLDAVNITGGVLGGPVQIDTSLSAQIVKDLASTLYLLISNINNANANAHAQLQLLTGGSSGGDPKCFFGVDSGGGFWLGVDNSDGDKGKIANINDFGSGDLLTWDQSGNFVLTGTLSLSTALPIASGGTAASNATSARSNLGAAASGTNTDITSIRLANTGLTVQDSSNTQIMRIVPGSSMTGTRVFTLTTGDINRTLDISAANVTISALGAANAALTSLTSNTLLQGNGSSAITASNSLAADLTVTSAASGATRTLLVQSTSNTASASALIESQVAGSTAADAYYKADISGGQNWTWGLDNSDSDAFVISSASTLGTNNIMRVATSGEINFPLQSCFSAYLNTTSTNATGDGTDVTVVCNTELFDQNSDYNNATGTFTAPVTGRYLFTIGATLTNVGGSSFVTYLNTSNRLWQAWGANAANMKDGGANLVVCGNAFLVDMDAADTATLHVQVSGGAKTTSILGAATNPPTFFAGYLAA